MQATLFTHLHVHFVCIWRIKKNIIKKKISSLWGRIIHFQHQNMLMYHSWATFNIYIHSTYANTASAALILIITVISTSMKDMGTILRLCSCRTVVFIVGLRVTIR